MGGTSKTKLRRKPSRGSHEREVVNAILDEALVSHLGLIDGDGFPVVTPTLHARVGSHVYVHGSAASRTIRTGDSSEVCLTATLLDGLVLARAAVHHSANYRSVMVFGVARQIHDADEKLGALEALPRSSCRDAGRTSDRRPRRSSARPRSFRSRFEDASAKVRSGPPLDDDADLSLPVWAGVVGLD